MAINLNTATLTNVITGIDARPLVGGEKRYIDQDCPFTAQVASIFGVNAANWRFKVVGTITYNGVNVINIRLQAKKVAGT